MSKTLYRETRYRARRLCLKVVFHDFSESDGTFSFLGKFRPFREKMSYLCPKCDRCVVVTARISNAASFGDIASQREVSAFQTRKPGDTLKRCLRFGVPFGGIGLFFGLKRCSWSTRTPPLNPVLDSVTFSFLGKFRPTALCNDSLHTFPATWEKVSPIRGTLCPVSGRGGYFWIKMFKSRKLSFQREFMDFKSIYPLS